ncbi:PREDICTED: photosynthetic NDH subunit of lumenal location 2, chloroplastic [Ipomoea nil]|uniref:photosynthetic NDH subunit of lumenal location 2, chloroplastic n=1 Tax=Ipomoea nil TaxID=35883 RepID=UPI000901D8C3|nr:PREDICTED: photosynthetic NDH subunit of lumenal location 2, chloroplastic [Ipomoea nil]
MATTLTSSTIPFHPQISINKTHNPPRQCRSSSLPKTQAKLPEQNHQIQSRRNLVTTLLATSLTLGLNFTPLAFAQNWGTRSFLRERFFEPGLSPEDAVARIRQTAEGLHGIETMLEKMSWKYVLFYLRQKSAYLSQDMKTAMYMVPQTRQASYVDTANQLVDNINEFDFYVRTPKVFESMVYYKKTLKSIDDLVALLA